MGLDITPTGLREGRVKYPSVRLYSASLRKSRSSHPSLGTFIHCCCDAAANVVWTSRARCDVDVEDAVRWEEDARCAIQPRHRRAAAPLIAGARPNH